MRNRRAFIRDGSLALFTAGLAPSFLMRTATASPAPYPNGPVLVTVFLRGAMDGLMAVQPVGDPRLRELRPRLALSETSAGGGDRALDLGCGFGLHPALRPLVDIWETGELAIVHAVGSPHPTRSHFDAQDYMETGTPGRKGTPSGWLNRSVRSMGESGSPLRAVAISESLPRSLAGDSPAVAVADLTAFDISSTTSGRRTARSYATADDPRFVEAGREALECIGLIRDARNRMTPSRIRYPSTDLGRQLAQVATLVRADLGLEIAACESTGWDTHVRQGLGTGSFANAAADLAGSLAAFRSDLGPDADRVVVLTMTEFGRTAAENGSGGTDHGHGSCLFVLGRRVDGGKIHGEFPGLARDRLYEGRDLAVSTDFRSVFAEVAASHLGVDSPDLFPGWSGPRLPLIRKG